MRVLALFAGAIVVFGAAAVLVGPAVCTIAVMAGIAYAVGDLFGLTPRRRRR